MTTFYLSGKTKPKDRLEVWSTVSMMGKGKLSFISLKGRSGTGLNNLFKKPGGGGARITVILYTYGG